MKEDPEEEAKVVERKLQPLTFRAPASAAATSGTGKNPPRHIGQSDREKHLRRKARLRSTLVGLQGWPNYTSSTDRTSWPAATVRVPLSICAVQQKSFSGSVMQHAWLYRRIGRSAGSANLPLRE